MPRVIGIDPGTVSVDICGLDDRRVFIDRSIPTVDALANPALIVELLERAAPLEVIAGPSGYGLPLTLARDLSDSDIRLATLAPSGEEGGISGLSSLLRALRSMSLPVMLTPGVVHLASVPVHRKINRVDMGTADKVCAVALAIHEQARRRQCQVGEVSFILLELGGAFTAAVAVERGQIVDGLGGSSGPMGGTACGALDGEVAFLASQVTKRMIFSGGAATVAGAPDWSATALAHRESNLTTALTAYVESAVKAVATLKISAADARHVVLSGRLSQIRDIREPLASRLSSTFEGMTVEFLTGFGAIATHAAQGAALLADGLAGGEASSLVECLGLREASGTVLDNLYVITPAAARQRLGITQ